MDVKWSNLAENISLEDYIGFVYKITHIPTGKYYIGKKFFWKILKRPPLKGKKNKRHEKQPSDWKEYWGSSEELLKDNPYLRDRDIESLIKKISLATF